jgi:hypothetical protein
MAVVQVVKKHVDNIQIQKEGIRVLWSFTYPKFAKKLVGDIGGVEVILAGVTRHPENSIIHWGGVVV